MIRTQFTAMLALVLLACRSMLLFGTPPPRTDLHGDPLPDRAVKRFGSTRLRHLSPVRALAWSPDGKLVASAGQEGIVCTWNSGTGRLVRSFKGVACCLAFTPDGKGLAAGLDGRIRIWEITTGKELHCFDALPEKVRQLAERRQKFRFPGGDIVDGQFFDERWNPQTTSLAFSPDGRQLAAAGGHSPTTWNVATKQRCFALEDSCSFVAFTPNGKQLVTADNARSVRLWDARTGKKTGGFETEGPKRHVNIFSFALSPDGKHAALKLLEHVVIVELDSGKVVWREKSPGHDEEPVAFSPDGRLLASVNFNWKRKGKKDDPAAATGAALHLWETATATEVLVLPIGGQNRCAFSPDGTLLALPTPTNQIRIWDLRRGCEHQRFKDFHAQVFSLAFSPDGRRLVSGLSDSTLLVWNVAERTATVGKLGVEKTARAWADLAGKDAVVAFRARGALASVPAEAMPLLAKRLRSAQSADPQRLRRLLTDLESDQFAVREKAQEALAKLGDLAEPSLRQTLANKPSLEVRQRVQGLLERLRGPVTQPEMRQGLRGVAVLEDVGTAEGRRLLETLADGAPEARLTREARASLRRLDLRSGGIPSP